MAGERKLKVGRVRESATTSHIGRRIGERIDYSESTKHIEAKLVKVTSQMLGKGSQRDNGSGK